MANDCVWSEDTGIPVSLIEAVLQHALLGAAATYIRSQFSRETARAVRTASSEHQQS